MKKILIVGASGYVGSTLSRMLNRDYQVIGTYLYHPVKADWEMIKLDVQDRQAVQNTIQRFNPDIIFHLAYSMDNLSGSIVEGTCNLIKAWNNRLRNSRFVFVSTDIVFSGTHPPYKETDEPDPIVPYGEAKHQAEMDVLAAKGVVVRTSLVYGFDPPDPRTNELLRGLEGGMFNYSYFEDEFRCPIHVSDLCQVLAEIDVDLYDRQPIWHVAGPERLSRFEFAQKLTQISGFDPQKVPRAAIADSGLLRPRDVSLDCMQSFSYMRTFFRTVGE